jgi:hypothetical protein
MARAFEAVCDCGVRGRRRSSPSAALAALTRHVCAVTAGRRCGMCRHWFWVLVDDSDLCVRCDQMVFPS